MPEFTNHQSLPIYILNDSPRVIEGIDIETLPLVKTKIIDGNGYRCYVQEEVQEVLRRFGLVGLLR